MSTKYHSSAQSSHGTANSLLLWNFELHGTHHSWVWNTNTNHRLHSDSTNLNRIFKVSKPKSHIVHIPQIRIPLFESLKILFSNPNSNIVHIRQIWIPLFKDSNPAQDLDWIIELLRTSGTSTWTKNILCIPIVISLQIHVNLLYVGYLQLNK